MHPQTRSSVIHRLELALRAIKNIQEEGHKDSVLIKYLEELERFTLDAIKIMRGEKGRGHDK